jgi:PilZ domain
MQHGDERRGDARHGVAPGVTVTTKEGARLSGEARNVSLGGLFVRCRPDLAPGTDCEVTLTFRAGRRRTEVRLLARVARADPEGLALEYTYLDADNHARLHERLSTDGGPPAGD